MKKLSVLAAGSLLLLFGCSKSVSDKQTKQEDAVVETNNTTLRSCFSYEVLEENIKADPTIKKRMDEIEKFTQKVLENPSAYKLVNGVMEVPVQVNVLWRTSAENISDAQIQSQIDVLNEDFGATNSDYSLTPALFQGARSGDTKIRFIWTSANTTRKQTSKNSWGTRDAMKKSKQGGIDPTSPATTLNMWVCTIGGGILGYAQFPGGSLATDGVVIDSKYFGRVGTATAPYGLGRTATHEIGHYFNLRHIWGDATCGNDGVSDTPTHNTSNGGCPTYPHYSTCAGNPVEMTMNYMDYTYDACMYMFTAGQASRMQATYAIGGPRASLIP
ncbi:zinc metalloprotease [Lacibacter luteus]|uniref:Zinc metalloprotease n=1 Tax=Lacibacter luteus TaxID=2508719 RepID=A0A4Q1CI35_9BACT|nr:zinc metalloprotease [Lacibacter luteus]RXK59765.1 zinc metalloprotease [Lacibacter luteus]